MEGGGVAGGVMGGADGDMMGDSGGGGESGDANGGPTLTLLADALVLMPTQSPTAPGVSLGVYVDGTSPCATSGERLSTTKKKAAAAVTVPNARHSSSFSCWPLLVTWGPLGVVADVGEELAFVARSFGSKERRR